MTTATALSPDAAAKVVGTWKFDWTKCSKRYEPADEDKCRVEFKPDHSYVVTGEDPMNTSTMLSTADPVDSGRWTLKGNQIEVQSDKHVIELPSYTVSPDGSALTFRKDYGELGQDMVMVKA